MSLRALFGVTHRRATVATKREHGVEGQENQGTGKRLFSLVQTEILCKGCGVMPVWSEEDFSGF